MQNQRKKVRKAKPYSRWSCNTSSFVNSPNYAKSRSCTTLPIFSESIYDR